MVRYERNQLFTGRDALLARLNKKFRTPSTEAYHGRIALFGLEGIGKTQIALEYVYRFQRSYQRIYWIPGDTQASLLGGYKQIAERAELQTSHLSTAVEVAERVISWLEQEEGWLLVVDNLNNIKVLSMGQNSNLKLLLLPSTGDLQHTLITTRNPHYGDIPAQGMEICKYDRDASIQLLYKSSRITPLNQPELQAAERIVEKLCNLPLAIDQAAAYIREMEISFSKFLILYEEYRRDLTKWGPKGPQQYPYTDST